VSRQLSDTGEKLLAARGEVGLGGSMQIERLDLSDADAIRGCYEVQSAARLADDPQGAPLSARMVLAWLKYSWGGDPGEAWFVPGETPGAVRAWYQLTLPDLENLDGAGISLFVHPAFRRRGIGSALLRHALGRGTADGRTRLSSQTLRDSAGDSFARHAGFTPGIVEARRVLALASVPPGRIASIRADAERAAGGYSLLSWTGPTPDEHLDRVAAAWNAMNDAPRSEGAEERRWDSRRVRERGDVRLTVSGARRYTIIALHDGSGEMAAFTQLLIAPEHPEWAYQGLTAVTRPHRGHRLGLLVKAAMMEWLAGAEPRLERIETGNADSNRHMIAINETLGYELAGPGWLHLTAAVTDLMS
jgi:GNAT superfamily N-acetyltransferase/RimJ/RimL family protein N-acetyltransferase